MANNSIHQSAVDMQVIQQVLEAHKHSSHNEEELWNSIMCGCFYCQKVFAPLEVKEWIDERKGTGLNLRTAICPHCGIDSVLGDASGYPVVDPEFLFEMNYHWFS